MAPFNTSDLAEPTAGALLVNGERVSLAADANVLDVLRTETQRRGISTFAAFVDGRELNSLDEIGEAIEEGSVVEVRTYAKPGARA